MSGLMRAQAEAASAEQRAGISSNGQLPRGAAQSRQHAASAAGAGASGAAQPAGQGMGAKAGASLLRLGHALGGAMQRTQALRLLSAALLAYAWCSGWLDVATSPVPPLVAVVLTQAAIVAGGLLLLGVGGEETLKATADTQLQAAMPARMRRFDFLSLVPGAREVLASLLGYRQLLNGLSEDVSVYVFVCILLASYHQLW